MPLDSDPSPWLAVFGRCHVVLLHLPLGLLPGIFVLEFGAALLRKPAPRGAVGTLSVLTLLTAAAALASGLVLAGEKVESDLLGDHKKLAIAMTAVAALLPIFAFRQSRRPFRLALLAALGLSVPTGHLGGSLTHKSDFLWKPLQRTASPGPAPAAPNDPGPALAPEAPNTEPAAPKAAPGFAADVRPILERVCVACHNPEKEKGDLLLTDAEFLDRTGDDRVVVPGKPDESVLLQLCELPLDDEDHMPPAEEPQPTKDELATLRAWILSGAAR